MSQRGPKNPERSFGLSVGTVLTLIAAALWWRGRLVRAEIIGAVGLVLLFFGAVRPSVLRWPSRWWWRFARALGNFNARVLLTLMFAVVLVPLGLVWRLVGRDPLGRRRGASGWSPYPSRYRDREHFLRMY